MCKPRLAQASAAVQFQAAPGARGALICLSFSLLFQTLSVSMLLRYSHHQIFVFIGKHWLRGLGCAGHFACSSMGCCRATAGLGWKDLEDH